MWSLRAFRAAIVDAVFATIVLVLQWTLDPISLQQALILVGIWQVPVVMYIVGPQIEAKAQVATLTAKYAQPDTKVDPR